MDNSDLHWLTFRDIENEVIDLSRYVYFCDKHLNVYSSKIADLVMYTCVEIEAVINSTVKKNPSLLDSSIGGVISNIDSSWTVSKKMLRINCKKFGLGNILNSEIKPLSYAAHSKNDFYSSYCSIKHNKAKNLTKGNINTLVRALAALYIYTTLYEQPSVKYTLRTTGEIPSPAIPKRSKLFSPYCVSFQNIAEVVNGAHAISQEQLDQALFVAKFSDDTLSMLRSNKGLPVAQLTFGDSPLETILNPTPITCETVTNTGLSIEEIIRL